MKVNYMPGPITVKNFTLIKGGAEGFIIHGSKRRRKSIRITDCTVIGGFDSFMFWGQPKKRKALIHKGKKP